MVYDRQKIGGPSREVVSMLSNKAADVETGKSVN